MQAPKHFISQPSFERKSYLAETQQLVNNSRLLQDIFSSEDNEIDSKAKSYMSVEHSHGKVLRFYIRIT